MGVKMLGKILGGLMVLGITTIPAPLVAASKLEITDPRAAKIKEIVTLPIKGIRAVESDGQIVFISDNGRFVITGALFPKS
uniref:disulfide isomerase DsbC N-terminal domain-containing protein n=1 Tax=Aeromonas rivuli TaxID=648794 RepID=UPI0005AB88DC